MESRSIYLPKSGTMFLLSKSIQTITETYNRFIAGRVYNDYVYDWHPQKRTRVKGTLV